MEAHWGLAETVAWIARRSDEAVAAEREQWRFLTTASVPGEADAIRDKRAAAWGNTPLFFRKPGREAYELLRAQCEAGVIPAYGRRDPLGPLEPMPAAAWLDLTPQMITTSLPTAAVMVVLRPANPLPGMASLDASAWFGVTFRVADVKKAFPPRAASPASEAAPPALEPASALPPQAPAFPTTTLPGRLAEAMWRERPLGRQDATLKTLRSELAKFEKKFSDHSLGTALALLAAADPERWPKLR
jgi:hypothetical protein